MWGLLWQPTYTQSVHICAVLYMERIPTPSPSPLVSRYSSPPLSSTAQSNTTHARPTSHYPRMIPARRPGPLCSLRAAAVRDDRSSLTADRKPIYPQTTVPPRSRVLHSSALAILVRSNYSPDPVRVRVLGLLVYSAVSSLSLPLLGPCI